jgi:hypothetical protein
MSTAVTTTGGPGWLVCDNMQQAMQLADTFSKSAMVPKAYQSNPANCLVAMAYGASLGMAPLQAMQSIGVVNGVPALYGDGLLALVQGSPLCEYIAETIEDGAAVCRAKRRGSPEVVRVFTIDDAKRAGLWGKQGPWQQYPQRMLQMRARSWALRDAFADVLRGIQSAEEVRDIEVIEVQAAAPAAAALPAPSKAEQVLAKARARKPRPEPVQPEPQPEPQAPAEDTAAADTGAGGAARNRVAEIGLVWSERYSPDHKFVKMLRALYGAHPQQAAGLSARVDAAVETLDREDHEAARADVLEIYQLIESGA